MKHIDHALVAKTHPPMYYMHKYWARKPHNVVREYIEHYTDEGKIVLDPFCGSGVTCIESLKSNRKSIGVDLDPMAVFITEMTAKPIDLEKLQNEFKKIEDGIKKRIMDSYQTKCNNCNNMGVISHVVWERDENNIRSTAPKKIWYNCECNKKRLSKDIDKQDLKRITSFEKNDVPYWFPDDRLIWNSRINVEKDMKISDLFTKRNLYNLALLYDEIEKIKDKNTRQMMKFIFTAFIANSSRMNFMNVGGYRSKGRGWAIRGYWIPPEYFEQNVWHDFESKSKYVIEKGKKQANEECGNYKKASVFKELLNEENFLLINKSVLELTDFIPVNSVDYVFTDPPYGDAVPYLELHYMWSRWLKFDPDFENEIIVSDSPERNKDDDVYSKMLQAAFKQVFQVLKPGKYLTVTFHSTNIKYWNAIIKSVVFAGFDLEKIVYQPPAKASAKGLLAPYGSAHGDYYIRFLKPKEIKTTTERELDLKSYENEVITAAKRIIGERAEPTSYQHILNGIMVDLKGGKRVPIGAKNIEKILRENIGKEFELVEIRNKKDKLLGKKWWVLGWDITHFSQPVLNDRIERAIISLLDSRFKASFDDILQEIFIQFPNALTPDTQSIKNILEEYGTKTKDKKWRLKTGYSEKSRINKHSKMIYHLAIIGKKFGFNIWVGKREQGEKYKNIKLSNLSDEFPELHSISDDSERIKRIKQIDVIWHRKGEIRYTFEVENTTSITDAIIRGANIKPKDDSTPLKINRYLIIPKTRIKLLVRKMNEPLIKNGLTSSSWKFITYENLKNYCSKIEKKKKIGLIVNFERLAEIPKITDQKQMKLKEFSN